MLRSRVLSFSNGKKRLPANASLCEVYGIAMGVHSNESSCNCFGVVFVRFDLCACFFPIIRFVVLGYKLKIFASYYQSVDVGYV